MKSFLHFRYYDLCLRPYFWFISFTDSFKDPAFDFFFFTRCFWFCRFLIHASFLLSFPRWRPRLLISVLSFLSYINYIDEFPLNYCVFCSLHFSFYWKLIFSYPIILSMSSPDLPPLLSHPFFLSPVTEQTDVIKIIIKQTNKKWNRARQTHKQKTMNRRHSVRNTCGYGGTHYCTQKSHKNAAPEAIISVRKKNPRQGVMWRRTSQNATVFILCPLRLCSGGHGASVQEWSVHPLRRQWRKLISHSWVVIRWRWLGLGTGVCVHFPSQCWDPICLRPVRAWRMVPQLLWIPMSISPALFPWRPQSPTSWLRWEWCCVYIKGKIPGKVALWPHCFHHWNLVARHEHSSQWLRNC